MLHALVHTFAASACTDDNFCTNLPTPSASAANLHNILQIVFAILAATAVLVIVIAAFSYVRSEGDPAKADRAKGTIVYALIGLVVALLAEAIVTFVLGKL